MRVWPICPSLFIFLCKIGRENGGEGSPNPSPLYLSLSVFFFLCKWAIGKKGEALRLLLCATSKGKRWSHCVGSVEEKGWPFSSLLGTGEREEKSSSPTPSRFSFSFLQSICRPPCLFFVLRIRKLPALWGIAVVGSCVVCCNSCGDGCCCGREMWGGCYVCLSPRFLFSANRTSL